VKNFLVAVKSKPDVYFVVSSDTICSGQNIHILLQSHFPGTLFTWIAHGSAGISGFAAGSGTQINQVIFNSDYIPGTVTYIVTPAGACTGIPDSVTITVHPLPSVSFLSCNDTMVYIYTKPFKLAGGLPPGGIYSGAGYNPGTQMFYPVTAGTGIHILHYTYTNMFSCVSQASMRIHVLGSVLFNCGQNLVDIRDGRSYPTLTIGGQCWMRSNLNFGNPVSFLQSQRDNCLREKYCYNDITSNCASSGGLYQWDEVMQYQQDEGIQGFCPAGWHIPTQQDWITLFSNFTNNGFAGMPLKFTGYSGFNAFLNGLLFMDREWDFDTFATFFWSSTYHGMDRAWAHGMNSVNPSVSDYPALRSNAFSVRCLKD
jgi:uncharacterized protein (TIGR02145 family)